MGGLQEEKFGMRRIVAAGFSPAIKKQNLVPG